jgi:hypothetical protein
LVQIQELPVTIEEQAEVAFHKVSEMYGVPKNPEDIKQQDDDENENYNDNEDADFKAHTSVYEELGLLKYLMPNEDKRGIALNAIYFVKNGYTTNKKEVMLCKFGKNIPDDVGIGFKGNNTNVEIVFVLKGESWFDLGCKMFTKYV